MSVMVREPELLPVLGGVKVTLTVQLPLGVREVLPQLLEPKFPEATILVMMRVLVPELEMERLRVAVVPTTTLPKEMGEAERVTA